MKLLGLLRHAKSSWDDPALDDFDRPLNERGRKAAVRMGEEFRKLELDYDLALVSPARRAAETFALVHDRCRSELQKRAEPRIYAASVENLLAIIGETPVPIERLLLVGHNPGFHELAMQLTKGSDSPQRTELAAKLPTGSLVEIGLGKRSWAQADSGGELLRFVRPRDFD
ncbi:MAG: histidine phosphatase family protein [Sphingomonas sp.]|nr:histidine phosphatase family protein [Sphingomonas sp.]